MTPCDESPMRRAGVPMPNAEPVPSAIVVTIGGSMTARPGAPPLCERVRYLLTDSGADVAILDVAALTDPDVGTVDALARVLLTARRLGRDVRLRHASKCLLALLALAGLDDIVLCSAGHASGGHSGMPQVDDAEPGASAE